MPNAEATRMTRNSLATIHKLFRLENLVTCTTAHCTDFRASKLFLTI